MQKGVEQIGAFRVAHRQFNSKPHSTSQRKDVPRPTSVSNDSNALRVLGAGVAGGSSSSGEWPSLP